MMEENKLIELHDRATRGETLSTDERLSLEAWYAQKDQEESERLVREPAPPSVASLRDQVDRALKQLHSVTQRIEVLTVENATLRREIAVLHQRVSQKTTA